MTGQVVYTAIVLMVNFKILSDFHNFHLIGELFIANMLMNFFGFYYIENLVPQIDSLYNTFHIVMGTPVQTYLCVLLCVGLLATVDRMVAITWETIKRGIKKDGRGQYVNLLEV